MSDEGCADGWQSRQMVTSFLCLSTATSLYYLNRKQNCNEKLGYIIVHALAQIVCIFFSHECNSFHSFDFITVPPMEWERPNSSALRVKKRKQPVAQKKKKNL